jgi:Cu/Ag efflux protein CusF
VVWYATIGKGDPNLIHIRRMEHMKKVAVVLAVVVLVVSLVSLAFAAEAKKGTIKAVDAKAGTITLSPEGGAADMTLKADKGVDLSKVKAGDKVEVSVEKDTVMGLKAAAAKKAPVGC